jgi:hypothetical protein
MPTFYAENIDIDVDEFIDSCSRKEINELIDYLVEDGYVIKVTGIKQSVPEAEFNQLLDKLSQNRLCLTNEEEELLKKIASRF